MTEMFGFEAPERRRSGSAYYDLLIARLGELQAPLDEAGER